MPADNTSITFRPSHKLFPFQSRWFDSSVGRVHYVDEGEGRPILLLHGNPTWSFLYRGVIARLRDDFRCVAVDYPGFGLSERPAVYDYTPAEHASVVKELVNHLGLEDLIIMGQDWGGPIGISVAVSMPKRVSGLIFGNTWFWRNRRVRTALFSWAMSSSPLQNAILDRNFFVERLVPMGTARRPSEEVMDHYRLVQPSRETRRGVAEFPRQIQAAGNWLNDLEQRVPDTIAEIPLLLVWGMKDFAFPPQAYVPRWQASFRDRVLVELPHAKHFIQEDAPAEIVMAIRSRFAPRGLERGGRC